MNNSIQKNNAIVEHTPNPKIEKLLLSSNAPASNYTGSPADDLTQSKSPLREYTPYTDKNSNLVQLKTFEQQIH